MSRTASFLSKVVVSAAIIFLAAAPDAAGQGRPFSPGPPGRSGSYTYTPVVRSNFYPFFGYSSPFIQLPSLPPPYAYMPKYWWTGSYGIDDPRQSGYNPSAGYRWDDVATVILSTYPKESQVILDGNEVGRSENMGPIQMPFGEHTLRVEAPGFEPSETVVHVEKSSFQRLQINLKANAKSAAPSL